MIDIGFVNLILIIADNVSGFGKPGNPCSFAFIMPGSFRSSTLLVSGSCCSSTSVEFFNPSNSMADFLVYVYGEIISRPDLFSGSGFQLI